jgi:thiol-disulfide isomerase/thioredoxin
VQFGSNNNDSLIFRTIDGESVDVETKEQEVVVLYFFRLNCLSCKNTDPLIAAINMDYNEAQLLIITITIDPADSEENLQIWRDSLNASWYVVKDDVTNTYASAYNIAFSPTTLIFDQERNLAARFEGTGDFDYLVRFSIDNILN